MSIKELVDLLITASLDTPALIRHTEIDSVERQSGIVIPQSPQPDLIIRGLSAYRSRKVAVYSSALSDARKTSAPEATVRIIEDCIESLEIFVAACSVMPSATDEAGELDDGFELFLVAEGESAKESGARKKQQEEERASRDNARKSHTAALTNLNRMISKLQARDWEIEKTRISDWTPPIGKAAFRARLNISKDQWPKLLKSWEKNKIARPVESKSLKDAKQFQIDLNAVSQLHQDIIRAYFVKPNGEEKK